MSGHAVTLSQVTHGHKGTGEAARAETHTPDRNDKPCRAQAPVQSVVGELTKCGGRTARVRSMIIRRIRHIVRDAVASIVRVVSLGLNLFGEAGRHLIGAAIIERRRLDVRPVVRRRLISRLRSGVCSTAVTASWSPESAGS